MTVYGDPEALASLKTMEDARRYQSDPSHLPLRPRTTYENLLRHIFMLYSREIVDSESGMLKPGKIAELLETVKVLGEANDSRASFDESEEGEIRFYYNTSLKSQSLPGGRIHRIAAGRYVRGHRVGGWNVQPDAAPGGGRAAGLPDGRV